MDPWFGKYSALVITSEDPNGQARLQVAVPAAGLEDVWARACMPPVDPSLVVMPQAGQGVWVEFEAGDLSSPIWTGVQWPE